MLDIRAVCLWHPAMPKPMLNSPHNANCTPARFKYAVRDNQQGRLLRCRKGDAEIVQDLSGRHL